MEGSYDKWSQQQLIARIQELEARIQSAGSSTKPTAQTNVTSFSNTTSQAANAEPPPIPYRKPPKQRPKAFDASKYSTRLIALKFAYLGQKYNGFEHHKNNSTPLPTIEEELWKALVKTRLISPMARTDDGSDIRRSDRQMQGDWKREESSVDWEGCEYSKCGRTDRGVSAFGQVIGIRVRSNRPLSRQETSQPDTNAKDISPKVPEDPNDVPIDSASDEEAEKPFTDPTDEIPYIQTLNRVLPPDIRIYAWCPKPPPDFSARFSCKERRYKYFFTNPCFAPVPGLQGAYHAQDDSIPMREGFLDIEKMRQACDSLIGLHDFRNFCKIDASKQLTNFERRIFHADIEEVSPLSVPSFLSHTAFQPHHPDSAHQPMLQPRTYAFTLHGSAFLWHQVRSLIAILFLIGQGLESPSLVPSLLDISANPTRPKYEMASDAPLVLWDCIFPAAEEVQGQDVREGGYEDSLEWVFVGDESGSEVPLGPSAKATGALGGGGIVGKGKWGRGGVVDDVWEVWHRDKIGETLSGLLLDRIAGLGTSTLEKQVHVEDAADFVGAKGVPRVFDGGDVGKARGNYIPVLQRERQEPVEVVNERYARRRGVGPKTAPRDDAADE